MTGWLIVGRFPRGASLALSLVPTSLVAPGCHRHSAPATTYTVDASPVAPGSAAATESAPALGSTSTAEAAGVDTSAPADGSDDTVYEGTIGASTPIRMRLGRSGNTLHGAYRYEKSKDDLRLSGTMVGNTFDLDETTATGTMTGHFHGIFADALTGTWSSTDGRRTLPFRVSKEFDRFTTPYPEIKDLGDGIRIIPQEASRIIAKFCTSRLVYPIIAGVGPEAKKRFDSYFHEQIGTFRAKVSDCQHATQDEPHREESAYTIGQRRGRWFQIQTEQSMSWSESMNPAMTDFDWSRGALVVVSLDTGEAVDLFSKVSSDGRKRLRDRCREIFEQHPRWEREPSPPPSQGSHTCDERCLKFAAHLELKNVISLTKNGMSVVMASITEDPKKMSDEELTNTGYMCEIPANEAKSYFESNSPAAEIFQ